VAAGSWLVLRRVAARRTGQSAQAAAEAGGGEELD